MVALVSVQGSKRRRRRNYIGLPGSSTSSRQLWTDAYDQQLKCSPSPPPRISRSQQPSFDMSIRNTLVAAYRLSSDGRPRRQKFPDTVSSLIWFYVPRQCISSMTLVLGSQGCIIRQAGRARGPQARRACVHTRCGLQIRARHAWLSCRKQHRKPQRLPMRARGRCGYERHRCLYTDTGLLKTRNPACCRKILP